MTHFANHSTSATARRRGLASATLLAAAAGFAALLVSAPAAHALNEDQAQSNCERDGGTWIGGKPTGVGGNLGACCVKNVATGKDDCKSVVYTAQVASQETTPTTPTRKPFPVIRGDLPILSATQVG